MMLLKAVMLKKTLESPLDCREIQLVNPKGNQLNFHWKDWCWNWSSNTSATWCEEQTHWKRSWYWETLKARGEGGNRGWDGWRASLPQRTWVCGSYIFFLFSSVFQSCPTLWNPMDCSTSGFPVNHQLQEIVKDWWAAVHGVSKSQTGMSNWTTKREDNCEEPSHLDLLGG